MSWKNTLLLAAILLLGSCREGEMGAADLVLHNGVIWTGSPELGLQESIAIMGRRIVAVGSDAELEPLRGPATRMVDLEGRLATPGITSGGRLV